MHKCAFWSCWSHLVTLSKRYFEGVLFGSCTWIKSRGNRCLQSIDILIVVEMNTRAFCNFVPFLRVASKKQNKKLNSTCFFLQNMFHVANICSAILVGTLRQLAKYSASRCTSKINSQIRSLVEIHVIPCVAQHAKSKCFFHVLGGFVPD